MPMGSHWHSLAHEVLWAYIYTSEKSCLYMRQTFTPKDTLIWQFCATTQPIRSLGQLLGLFCTADSVTKLLGLQVGLHSVFVSFYVPF
ncbi:hypothetical protein GDO78_012851 [Eleutherodactylus coqui]|uniref:Uncharacterized protein n=1 Tax=Eleutherodactylus coqui TaxID=57060 RepID=A0A8J6F1K3_ELECQ|nr:hypothetical protein GDO78_012851 [Eleutherodactylus coqui]